MSLEFSDRHRGIFFLRIMRISRTIISFETMASAKIGPLTVEYKFSLKLVITFPNETAINIIKIYSIRESNASKIIIRTLANIVEVRTPRVIFNAKTPSR